MPLLFVLIAVVCCFPAFADCGANDHAAQRSLETAITCAAEALYKLQNPDGSFVYLTRIDGKQTEDIYNITRHAGSLYGLNSYDAQYPETTHEEAIAKGLNFLSTQTRHVKANGNDIAYVVNAYKHSEERTILGASALGLIAILTAPKSSLSRENQELIIPLGRFLLTMQQDNGAFFSHYAPETLTADQAFVSLYYPGESALALVQLYSWDTGPDRDKWLTAAIKALLYLAEERRRSQDYPADNWALIATKALFDTGYPLKAEDRTKLIEHAEGIAYADIATRVKNERSVLNGALTRNGMITQTSARIEGLLAAMGVVQSPSLQRQIRHVLQNAMSFLLRTQVQSGPLAGAFTDHFAPNNKLSGQVVRIDYIQHALCAMLGYQRSGLPSP